MAIRLFYRAIVMDKDPSNNDAGQADRVPVDDDLILELNFVPDWARKPPTQASYYVDKPDRRRPAPRDGDRRGPPSRARPARPGRPTRDGRAPGRPERPPIPRRMPPEPAARPAPVDIRFLPDQRRLSAAVKKIHATGRAYPVVELASLFLGNPATCYVRIEVRPDAPDVHLLQCNTCGAVTLDRAPLLAHIVDAHLGDYFDKEEQLADPPSGDFVCIARCGLSGTLLGPPNHHSSDEKAREIQRTRYPAMSFAEYQNRIERLHDKDLIEKWKEESRKRTFYRLKGSPESDPMTWQDVEAHVEQHLAPSLVSRHRRTALEAAVARELKDQALRNAVSDAWRRESRFPMNLSNAMRGAFRHKQLYVFNAGRGRTFVTATRPVPLDKLHVIESIREVLTYLEQHPGCSRDDLREGLRPGSAPDSPEAHGILSPLGWLIERGHIIEFFNGSLAVPLRGASAPKRTSKPRHKRRNAKQAHPRPD